MISVGVDLVEVASFQQSLDRTPDLRDRIFTAGELAQRDRVSLESLAAWFAAKEAVTKALLSRFDVAVEWHDIMVRHGERGEPYVELSEELMRDLKKLTKIKRISLSLSHVSSAAVAMTVIESS